jgi:hypothetical protein
MFSRRPGQMREQCALRLITGLTPPVNLIRAAAAMILFCIFVTCGELLESRWHDARSQASSRRKQLTLVVTIRYEAKAERET